MTDSLYIILIHLESAYGAPATNVIQLPPTVIHPSTKTTHGDLQTGPVMKQRLQNPQEVFMALRIF